ncbi:MAG: TlpA disulfide reductase family protein [Alphaproteobacteria bacterium]|uniref:TlpA family protein disulfide reductase n=1 Tax=Marinobacter salarius TaxID=1420917 RepID=UPI0032EDFD18
MKGIKAVALVSAALIVGLALPAAGLAAEDPPISGSVQNFDLRGEPVSMPAVPVLTVANDELSLDDFRGRVVLINFWATWCSGSWRELPTLERLQAKLGGDDFSVVIVSQDVEGWEKITPFLKKRRLSFPESYLDEGAKLGDAVDLPPQMGSILIDENGREVGRLEGPADWDTPEAAALIQYFIDKIGGST